MTPYNSRNGKKTGVTAFEAGTDYIIIEFGTSRYVKYTYHASGSTMIEYMKALALSQYGLSTFIAQNKPVQESEEVALTHKN